MISRVSGYLPMKRRLAATMLLMLYFVPSSRGEVQMSMETSWENVPRCSGRIGKNATMIIKNAPRGTKFINATLTSGWEEYGGERVPLPENGIIPEGAIHPALTQTITGLQWLALVFKRSAKGASSRGS